MRDFEQYGVLQSPDKVYHLRPIGFYRTMCQKVTNRSWFHLALSSRWDKSFHRLKICEDCAKEHHRYIHNRYRRERRPSRAKQ